MSQIRKGAVLSFLTIILTNLMGLILTPFIIRQLGDAEYGLYILIGSFIGYISLLDFGLNNAIIRYIAQYRYEGDKESETHFLSTTMIIYLFLASIVVIIGSILYYNLEWLFNHSLSAAEMVKAKRMYLVLVFNVAISFPGGAFIAICNGYEQFVFPRIVKIIRYFLRSLTVWAILYWGGDAVSIVILDTILNLLGIIISAFYVYKVLGIQIRFRRWDFSLARQLFSYSIWIFLYAIVLQFHWNGGQFILGIKTNTVTVAIYAVGITIGSYYSAFSGAISSLFLPRATKMVVQEMDGETLTGTMIKIGRISLMILLGILGGFILFGKEFMVLWVGNAYANSWCISLIIMIVYTVPLVQNFANALLEARSKFYFKSIVYFIFIVFGTVIGSFMIDSWGELGMIYGITIGWMCAILIVNIYYSKKMNLDIFLFFRKVSHKILLVFAVSLIIGVMIRWLPGSGWGIFFIKASIYGFLYAAMVYKFAMNRYEIDLFKAGLKIRK